MRSTYIVGAALALGQAAFAQMPVEVYQRWLMIIKPNANAGGEWVGTLNQDDIDSATDAFKHTWPRM